MIELSFFRSEYILFVPPENKASLTTGGGCSKCFFFMRTGL